LVFYHTISEDTPTSCASSNYLFELNNSGYLDGLENQLNLPFNLSEVVSQFCPNFRMGALYINSLIHSSIGAPNPLKKIFLWHSGIVSGNSLQREKQWKDENHLYIINPSQWKFIDKHLKMVLLVWMRGKETSGDKTRYNWEQIESCTGVSQRNMRNLLRETEKIFPDWFRVNNPPSPPTTLSLSRSNYRALLHLPDRSEEWKIYRGHCERLMLLKQERNKGRNKKQFSMFPTEQFKSTLQNHLDNF